MFRVLTSLTTPARRAARSPGQRPSSVQQRDAATGEIWQNVGSAASDLREDVEVFLRHVSN
jgi:hypothetical protein